MPLALFFQKSPLKHTFSPLPSPPSGFPTTPARFRSLWRIFLGVVIVLNLIRFAAGAGNPPTLAWSANPEPDIAGYVVYVRIPSGEYQIIQDVGNVTSFVLPGLSSSEVYSCAVQAYNSSGLTSDLSAEITFTLQSAMEGFGAWAGSAGLTEGDALPLAMPHRDGVSNLAKFAFNLNGGGPDRRTLEPGTGTAGLPNFRFDAGGSQPVFMVEYLRRKNSGLIYTPKVSSDFVSPAPMAGTAEITDIDESWERVTIRKTINPAVTPRLFGWVEVTIP